MRIFQAMLKASKAAKRCRSGFTLVEVLVSVLILATALTGSLLVFTKSNILISEIQQYAIANQAIKEEIEEIRDLTYAEVLVRSSTFTKTSMANLANAAGTLAIDDALSDDDIRRVTATLAWDSPRGRSLSVSSSTYVTNSGINRQ